MLTILTAPHPILKKIAEPVDTVTKTEQQFLDDMLETMYQANGIGLAAPQVGVSRRMLVMDIGDANMEDGKDEDGSDILQLINPKIIAQSQETSEYQEGCLSFPQAYETIVRPSEVTVRYLDREGAERQLKAKGLLAVCVQHEIDHLNGVTFVDHLSRLKREMILRKMRKLQSN